jgi:hypothetical protein
MPLHRDVELPLPAGTGGSFWRRRLQHLIERRQPLHSHEAGNMPGERQIALPLAPGPFVDPAEMTVQIARRQAAEAAGIEAERNIADQPAVPVFAAAGGC